MEQSLYISKIAHLKYWNQEFCRLYFGMEFCERLMPSPSQLKKALTFAEENDLDFTLVTPYPRLPEGEGIWCRNLYNMDQLNKVGD